MKFYLDLGDFTVLAAYRIHTIDCYIALSVHNVNCTCSHFCTGAKTCTNENLKHNLIFAANCGFVASTIERNLLRASWPCDIHARLLV